MKAEDLMLFQFASDFDYFKDDATHEAQLKFFNDAQEVWDNQTYSHLDVQDEKGNTVLHYLFRNSNWDWVDQFLQRGANPFIENNEGKDAFAMAKKMDQLSSFWSRYDGIILDDSFKQRLSPCYHGFKELIYQKTIQKYHYFIRDTDFILQFLKDNELHQPHNIIMGLGHSQYISLSERISTYLSLTDLHSPLHQTNFLSFISKHPIKNEHNAVPLLEKLLTLPLEHNRDLDDVIVGFMPDYKQPVIKSVTEKLLDLYVINQWDITQNITYGVTVENSLSYYPELNSYYLNHKLSSALNEQENTAKMKL